MTDLSDPSIWSLDLNLKVPIPTSGSPKEVILDFIVTVFGVLFSNLNDKVCPDNEDVKAVAKPILRHRLVKNYLAEADGLNVNSIIAEIL